MLTEITALIRSPGFRPALRVDLQFFRGEAADVVVIHDPTRCQNLQLYEIECVIAKAMDGKRDLDGVTRMAKKHVPWVTRSDVEKLTRQLAGMGLLSNIPGPRITHPSEMPAAAAPRPNWPDGTSQDVRELVHEMDSFEEVTAVSAADGGMARGFSQTPAQPPPVPARGSFPGISSDVEQAVDSLDGSGAIAKGLPDEAEEYEQEQDSEQPAEDPQSYEDENDEGDEQQHEQPHEELGEGWSIDKPKWYRTRRGRRWLFVSFLLVVLAGLALIPYPLYITEPCAIRPSARVEVRAEIDGIISEILVEEGEVVKAGQAIARLNDHEVSFALRRAEADVEKFKANLSKLETGNRPEEIKRAKALVRAKQEDVRFAVRELARYRKLFAKGLGSAADRDQARHDLQLKRSAMSQAEAELRLAQAGFRSEEVSMAQAELKRATAEVEYLQKQLDKLTLVASIDGKVLTPRFRELLHQRVSAGDLVCEIADASRVRVEIDVPERDADVVKIGQPVTVKVHSLPLDPFRGQVSFIAPAVEVKDGSRILRVEAELDNPQGLMQPRMTGYAEINAGQRTVLVRITRRLIRWVRVRFLI